MPSTPSPGTCPILAPLAHGDALPIRLLVTQTTLNKLHCAVKTSLTFPCLLEIMTITTGSFNGQSLKQEICLGREGSSIGPASTDKSIVDVDRESATEISRVQCRLYMQ
jgi:hypothetical protein